MILEKLIELICDEIGIDGIDETTALSSLVEDEFELNELIQAVESGFEVELGDEAQDATVGELAEMIASES